MSQGTVYADGPNGPARGTGHSAVPAALHAAATFDRDLVHARGVIMGAESYGLGRQTLTAPMINMLRSPEAGRNFEASGRTRTCRARSRSRPSLASRARTSAPRPSTTS